MREPRISVNKLGEYLEATPRRRKAIINDHKKDAPFIAARYADAKQVIVNHLVEGIDNDEKLLEIAADLRVYDASKSDFSNEDRRLSASVIEDYVEIAEEITELLSDSVVIAVPATESHLLEIADVEVSVRPDILVLDSDGNVEGFIKLHFSKTAPLNETSRKHVATAIRHYFTQQDASINLDLKKCLTIDVPTSGVTNAPKAYKRSLSDIEAGCEEIHARWFK